MRSHETLQSVSSSVQVPSKTQAEISPSNFVGYVVIAIPIIVLLSIIGHKKYKTTVRRNRIAKLERLWHIHIDEKTH